jgi:PST family polysaccharide transporter
MPSAPASLTKTTGKALQWNYLGMLTKVVLAFGINTLLTRLLGPKPFGELAVAMIVFGFGSLLSNVGLTSALIQKETMDEADIRFCFTCQMGIGIMMTGILYATAPLWARFFHEHEIVHLLRVFSMLFVIQAFGTTPAALLNRKQDARSVQLISIVAYVISYLGVGVPMALLGKGVWSLVAAWLSQAFLNSVLSYAKTRHSLKPLLHPDHAPLLTFGIRILGANICSWGISNLDNTVVGRVAGPISLGFYSRAFALASTADSVTSGLLQVLLPAFSRVQGDREKLRRIYSSVFGLILLVLLPLFAAIAATADVVVLGLYGPKWAPAIPYVRPIALAMAINAAMALSGPLLAARGKPQKEFWAQLIALSVAVSAYIIAIRWSILALSWTVLAVYLLRLFLLTTAVHKSIGSHWSDLFATTWPALTLSLFAGGIAKLIAVHLPSISAPARLAILGLSSSFLVVLAFAAFTRTFLRPIFSRSPQLVALIPARLRPFAV